MLETVRPCVQLRTSFLFAFGPTKQCAVSPKCVRYVYATMHVCAVRARRGDTAAPHHATPRRVRHVAHATPRTPLHDDDRKSLPTSTSSSAFTNWPPSTGATSSSSSVAKPSSSPLLSFPSIESCPLASSTHTHRCHRHQHGRRRDRRRRQRRRRQRRAVWLGRRYSRTSSTTTVVLPRVPILWIRFWFLATVSGNIETGSTSPPPPPPPPSERMK